MKLQISWVGFERARTSLWHYFERRRGRTMRRLVAVTREMREALDARASAA